MWENYGKTFSEYMYLKNLKSDNHIEIKGKKILIIFLKKKNK